MTESKKPIILYDGYCNLCTRTIRFLLKKDKKDSFVYFPLQSEKGQNLLIQFDVAKEIDSVIFIHQDKVFFESEAVIKILAILPAPWKWLKLVRILPKSLTRLFYRWIAKNRFMWFGKRVSCDVF